MKKGLLLIIALSLLSLLLYASIMCLRGINSIVNIYQDNKRSVASMYEALSFKHYLRIDTTAQHVLCIGNSITLHGPLSTVTGADTTWVGNWGMCASLPDSDYVHRLEKRFKAINPQSEVEVAHMADWENNFSLPIDSFLKDKITGKDIVIIRLGENVSKVSEFGEAYARLVNYCIGYTRKIIVTGNYWHNSQSEQYMISVARENCLPYVPLSWIMDLYKEKVMPHVGDTIFDIDRMPYTIKTDFITTHPNDYGMRLIADAIWESIVVEE